MATWLDWYVKWRIEAPESAEDLAQQMRLGATDPLMAFAENISDFLAEWTVDRDEFARKVGNRKSAEEMGMRLGCFEPFLVGFATAETRKIWARDRPQRGQPLGIVLTRDTASLLSDAEPPQDNWRHLTFGSSTGEDNRPGVYIDVPHGALLVGKMLQIRAIFAVPQNDEGEDGHLHWTGGVLVHALVTEAGSEREMGAVFAAVDPEDHLSLLVMDPETIMGGIYRKRGDEAHRARG